LLSAILRFFKPMDELEFIMTYAPFEITEIIEFSNKYVIKSKDCDVKQIKEFKEYLKKAGFKSLSKKVVIVCQKSSIHF